MIVIKLIMWALGTYLSIYVGYNLFLIWSRYVINNIRFSPPGNLRHRIAVVIPAHNEELFLPRLLKSILSQEYPRDRFKAVVIADNCEDKTSEIAKQYGAIVYERFDQTSIGKGYTLEYGLRRMDMSGFDAIAIVDADCLLDRLALQAFDRALSQGYTVLQSYSGPANPSQSWFTRLLSVSHAFSNEILLQGKLKQGFSIPLMGTGMCFTTEVLEHYGWNAFSVGEDWEFYVKLISSGEIVYFVKDSKVWHQESYNLKQATSQRLRWASGRFEIAVKYGIRLLYDGLRQLDPVKIDASLPLLLPNPSMGANLTAVTLLLAAVFVPLGLPSVYVAWFFILCAIQFVFFLLGVYYTEDRWLNALSLLAAPVFLGWKLMVDCLSLVGHSRKNWVRTKRQL